MKNLKNTTFLSITSNILQENNYYPFGLKHGGYNKDVKEIDFDEYLHLTNEQLQNLNADELLSILPVIKNKYKYKYNGKEWQDEFGLNVTAMDFRQYDNALGRFMNPDALSELAPMHTPYRFGFNNPVYWSDPTGLYELKEDGTIVTTSEGERMVLKTYFENYDGTGDFNEGALAALHEAGFGLELVHLGDAIEVGTKRDGSGTSDYDNINVSTGNSAQEPNSGNNVDWQDVNQMVGAFNVTNGVKTKLIEYAGNTGELSKGTQNYLKAFKRVGYAGAVVNTGYAAYQLYENPTAGSATRLAVQGIAIGAVFIPGVGWAISLGIGAADMIWGDQFYEWIDN